MSAPSACPPPDALRRLLDDAPPPDLDELTAHVGSCPRCQRTLDALAGHPTLPSGATALFAPPPDPEQALVRALESLRLRPGRSSRGPGPREEWVVSFLAPSRSPGTLGRLGDYDVVAVLGQGGMGIVLEALDPSLGRRVAIKVLAPHLANDPGARQRFAREARAAAAVRHENVVTIYAVAEAAGLPFLVMELVSGGSLQDHLDRHGPLPAEVVARVGAQAAAGLAAAHAQGLVHRDIKPANILLDRPGPDLAGCTVKITDFGLARAADEASLTQSGVVAGTPLYMAPEQAFSGTVGPAADLFALGSVLYTLCAGRPPFEPGPPLAVLRSVCDAEPTPLEKLAPTAPRWLVAVVAALHAKKPAERFPSAAALADLLRRHLAHLEAPDTAPAPPDTVRLLRRPRRRRGRRLLLAAGLLVLVTLGVAAFLVWRRPTPRFVLEGHTDPVHATAFSPHGQLLATGADDNTVRLWSAKDGSLVRTLRPFGSPVRGLVFGPEGDLLVAVSEAGTMRLWRPDSEEPIDTYPAVPAADGPLADTRNLAISPDGKVLAVATARNRALLLDLANARVAPRKGPPLTHSFPLYAVTFSPDGGTIVTVDSQGTMKVWGPDGRERRKIDRAHTGAGRALAFSPPDGRLLASAGSDKKVKLWPTDTWEKPTVLSGHTNGVVAVAFAPGGKMLASGGRDQAVILWDATAGRKLATLSGHGGTIWALAFSPDGHFLATGCEDKLVRVWDVSRWANRLR